MVTKKKEKPGRDDTEIPKGTGTLRKTAEKKPARSKKNIPGPAEKDPAKLLHELQVHQAELETQGEELRLAQAALLESRDNYQDLYDFAPVGYITLTDKALIAGINITAARHLGLERSRLLKARFRKYIAPDVLDIWDRFFVAVQKTAEPQGCTLNIRRADGSVFPARLDAVRITDNTGTITVRITFTDISGISLAEQALQESREDLQAFFNASSDPMVLIAPDGTILAANDITREAFGAPADTVIGKNAFDLLAPGIAKRRKRWVSEVIRTGRPAEYEDERSGRMLQHHLYPILDPEGFVRAIACYGKDITQGKRAEEALRESRQQLELALSGADEGLIDWDFARGTIVFNTQAALMLGYSPEEFPKTPEDFLSLVHLDDRSRGDLLFQDHLAGKTPVFDIEQRFRNASGQWQWILSRGKVVARDERGNPMRYLGTHVDISQSKNAEAKIRDSEEKYRTMTTLLRLMSDNMPDMIWAKDLQKRYIFANKAICRDLLNATSTEEPVGKPDMFFAERERKCHADDPAWHTFGEICRDTDQITMDTGVPQQFDESGNVQGKFLFLDVRKAPLIDETGAMIGTVGSARDVTRAKELEASLKTSEEFNRTLVENIPDYLLIYDLQGRILYTNRVFAEKFGYRENEALGSLILEHIPVKDQDRIRDMIAKRHADVAIPPYEVSILNKDGSPVPVIVKGSHIRFRNQDAVLVLMNDITEHKRMEMVLRESEERFRMLTENAPVGIYLTDANGDCTYVNREWSRITGLAFEKAQKKGWSKTLHPDDLPKVESGWYRMVESGGTWGMTYRFVPSPGVTTWVFGTAVKIQDSEGRVTGYLGCNIDITARKSAEDALQESEERLRQVTETITSVFYIHDRAANRFIYVSPAYERIWKRSCQSLLDDPYSWLEAVHKEDLPGLMESIRQELEDGVYIDAEYRILLPDGTERWIRSRNFPVSDEGGAAYRVAGIAEDITNLRQMQSRLQESEERFRKIFENSAMGMAIVAPDFRFVKVNPAFCTMMGYADEELTGMSFIDITHPDYLFQDTQKIRELASGGTSAYHTEKKYIRKDGGIVWGSLSVSTLRAADNHLLWFVAQVEDITERKAAEFALQESETSYRGLFNSIRQAVYILDTDGKFLDVNEGAEVMYGYLRSELLGRTPAFLSAPEKNDLALVTRNIRRAFAGETQAFEFWGQRKSGEIFPKDVYLYRGLYFGKDVVIAIGTEITDRKRSEQLIHDLNAYNRSLIEASPDPLVTIDREGRIMDVNLATEMATGLSRSALIGTDFSSYFTDHQKAREGYRSVFSKGIVRNYPLEIRHRDGHIMPVLYNATVYRDENDEIQGVFATARDITRIKRSEERLEKINTVLLGLGSDFSTNIQQITACTGELLGASFALYNRFSGDNLAVIAGWKTPGGFPTIIPASGSLCALVHTRNVDLLCVPDLQTSPLATTSPLIRMYGMQTYLGHLVRHAGKPIGSLCIFYTYPFTPDDEDNRLLGIIAAAVAAEENRRIAESNLMERDLQIRNLFEHVPIGMFQSTPEGKFVYCNPALSALLGYGSPEDLMAAVNRTSIADALYADPAMRPVFVLQVEAEQGGWKMFENQYKRKDGTFFDTILSFSEYAGPPGPGKNLYGFVQDITQRKHFEEMLTLSNRIFTAANQCHEIHPLLNEVVHLVQQYTGCEAIGIRLLDTGGNIPYHASAGFPPSFYERESPLNIRTDECMCIYVIRGDAKPDLPVITPHGSFYCNGTTKFLAGVSDEDKGRTRNACNQAGYESVALVAIKRGETILGLIHLADHRENLVPLEKVEVLEDVSQALGSVIQRMLAEEQVHRSLAEKEVLLREIHHRVKNNLAGVVAIIDLQLASLTDPVHISLLRDLETRIRSMALVHESLYLTKDLARINLADYTGNLTRYLFQVYATGTDVRCSLEMGDVRMPIATAIPCGLVISEIVTNSLKYAFPGAVPGHDRQGEPCTISLSLTREGNTYRLRIADNGIGIPKEIDVARTSSLGLYLIRFIVKHQLRGTLEISTENGTTYTILFDEQATGEPEIHG